VVVLLDGRGSGCDRHGRCARGAVDERFLRRS
jgi:hypothetical protein